MKIIPMRDLKNTVAIEEACREEGGPVFVTKNGYGRLVVMDIDYYEQVMQELVEANYLMKGIEDVKAGRLLEARTVLETIRGKYGLADRDDHTGEK